MFLTSRRLRPEDDETRSSLSSKEDPVSKTKTKPIIGSGKVAKYLLYKYGDRIMCSPESHKSLMDWG